MHDVTRLPRELFIRAQASEPDDDGGVGLNAPGNNFWGGFVFQSTRARSRLQTQETEVKTKI